MSQQQDIIYHLHNIGSITPIEALNLYGSFRLGAIIFNLRQDGYNIETKIEHKGRKMWARYSLVKV